MHSGGNGTTNPTDLGGSATMIPRPWWVTAVVIVGSLLLIAGAMVALLRPQMLLSPNEAVTPAVRVYAGYLVSRNLALALMLLSALRTRARFAWQGMMVLYALVQLLDAGMDVMEHRWAVVPGILLLALLFLLGAARLSPSPVRER
jgi:hypothetical protein